MKRIHSSIADHCLNCATTILKMYHWPSLYRGLNDAVRRDRRRRLSLHNLGKQEERVSSRFAAETAGAEITIDLKLQGRAKTERLVDLLDILAKHGLEKKINIAFLH